MKCRNCDNPCQKVGGIEFCPVCGQTVRACEDEIIASTAVQAVTPLKPAMEDGGARFISESWEVFKSCSRIYQHLGQQIDEIVKSHAMPADEATALLSLSVLYLSGSCRLGDYIDAVAHTRLCIPEDYQDSTAALAQWIDDANEQLKNALAEIETKCSTLKYSKGGV